MNRQYISWTDFGSMMDRLIHQVRQPSTQFTKVIGIARGVLFLLALLHQN